MDKQDTVELHPRYVVDAQGKRHSVLLSVREYEQLLDLIEDSNDASALDKAVEESTELIDLEELEAELARDKLL